MVVVTVLLNDVNGLRVVGINMIVVKNLSRIPICGIWNHWCRSITPSFFYERWCDWNLKKGYGNNVNQSILALLWLSKIEKGISDGNWVWVGKCESEIIMSMDMILRMELFINFMVVFTMDGYNAVLQKLFGSLNIKTKSVTNYLKECDLTVVEKRISVADMQNGKLMFGNNCPLRLRDALYGGVTSPVWSPKKYAGKEKINYINFTSLYPSVQKVFKYSVDHLCILVGQECEGVDFDELVGLVKCDILPPKHLYFPVLPLKINNKLLFVLCYLCVMEHKERCNHSDDQLVLSGIWCSPEIRKALEMGYEIVKAFEIYKYHSADDVFSSFVTHLAKLKQEHSGFPAWCYDGDGNLIDEFVEKFVSDYLECEGALLDRTLVCEQNFGLHNIVKLIFDALWGKFAQTEDRNEIVYVKAYEELIEFLDSHEYESVYFDFVDHNVLRLFCRKRSDQIPYSSDTNVVIASFVTCYPRLRLYEMLISLPSQCLLYYDTDSVIYHSPDGNELIECGSFLGEFKN